MSLFNTLTGESWRNAIHMARTEPNEKLAIIRAKIKSMQLTQKILILQSSASTAPEWVRQCQRTVELWADLNKFEYIHVGDEMFAFTPEYGRPFTKIQISDLARIRLINAHLSLGHYEAVYWLDSDFLIWNIYEFKLPLPLPGSVVCAREAYHTDHGTAIQLNNSVLGFCRREDAQALADLTAAALDAWRWSSITPPHIIAGPKVISKIIFPLRRIIAKQAGCFSEFTIARILGPWLSGRAHLWWLSLANGATLRAANLCSSRSVDPKTMDAVVTDLICGDVPELNSWESAAPIYRAWLAISNFPFRVRCWIQTRLQKMRKSLIRTSA